MDLAALVNVNGGSSLVLLVVFDAGLEAQDTDRNDDVVITIVAASSVVDWLGIVAKPVPEKLKREPLKADRTFSCFGFHILFGGRFFRAVVSLSEPLFGLSALKPLH